MFLNQQMSSQYQVVCLISDGATEEEDGGAIEQCRTTLLGTEYSGAIAQTANGKTCQRWDSQSPHSHSNNADDLFPEGDVRYKYFFILSAQCVNVFVMQRLKILLPITRSSTSIQP